ncbi:hypothetical protein LguiB_009302 [Lonicera macranthoides]
MKKGVVDPTSVDLVKQVEDLRKLNDNLMNLIAFQSERIRHLEGKPSVEGLDDDENDQRIEALLKDLVVLRRDNTGLRLDLSVVQEKLQSSEAVEQKGEPVAIEEVNQYDVDFPKLGDVKIDKVEQGKSWALVTSMNRCKSTGVKLQHVQPIETDGQQCIQVTLDEVHDELVDGRGRLLLLVVKPWGPEVCLEKEGLANIPIWIKLPGLKLHLWSTPILSKIVSLIGKPLFTDMMTVTSGRLTYARLCVEIGIDALLPTYVMIKYLNGDMLRHSVEYDWLPMICNNFNMLGHQKTHCNKKVKLQQIWRVKEVKLMKLKQYGEGFTGGAVVGFCDDIIKGNVEDQEGSTYSKWRGLVIDRVLINEGWLSKFANAEAEAEAEAEAFCGGVSDYTPIVISIVDHQRKGQRPFKRVRWLQCGDKNMAYFHRRMKVNRARNKILSITDLDGNRVEGEEAVHKEVVRFFSLLLGQCNSIRGGVVNVRKKLQDWQKKEIMRPMTSDDVRAAMFSIDSKKAPGPDGYNAGFFKAN